MVVRLPRRDRLCVIFAAAEQYSATRVAIQEDSAHFHGRAKEHLGQSLPAVWCLLRHVSGFILLGGSRTARAGGRTDRADQSLARVHGGHPSVRAALSRARGRHRTVRFVPRLLAAAFTLPRAAARRRQVQSGAHAPRFGIAGRRNSDGRLASSAAGERTFARA
jgi:hypothetical protein